MARYNKSGVPNFVKLLALLVVLLVAGVILVNNIRQQGNSILKEQENPPAQNQTEKEENTQGEQVVAEKRAVWVSYLELEHMLKGKSQEEFEGELEKVFANMKNLTLNTLILQVRPYGDALYPSKVYPWSYYASGEQGKNPGFDPLQTVIDKAKENTIQVEAWINPYRVKGGNTTWELSSENPAQKHGDWVLEYEGGLYYDPGNDQVKQMIVAGVKELVENYDISAVQFDDYFYPTGDESYDKPQYEAYKSGGGTLDHKDFRREQVNRFVQSVYKTIKEVKPEVQFGISPQGNNTNNYEVMCIDVKKWVTEEGYVDYIAPQLYWGFEHQTAAFDKKVQEWVDLVDHSKVDLVVGLGAYRIGETEKGAGTGKEEWKEHTDILSRQVTLLHNTEQVKGFVLYRYDSIFDTVTTGSEAAHKTKERENLKEALVKEQ